MAPAVRQKSLTSWTCKRGHSTILPDCGESNEFVFWISLSRLRGRGYWGCRICNRDKARNRYRRVTGSTGRRCQVPGQSFKFLCGCTIILPTIYGEQNELVIWHKEVGVRSPGNWRCRKCEYEKSKNIRKGNGKNGLVGRFKFILTRARCEALRRKYSSPKILPEELVTIWVSQENSCAACGCEITILSSHLDHNHRSGKVRGFVCKRCNWAMGYIEPMSEEEFVNFSNYFWKSKIR